MGDEQKVSIRFYNDRQVRAVWDEAENKWWFSVLDIVGIFNDDDDYTKTRNYWKYLKAKLKKEQPELVSATNQLKLLAADGKRYFAAVRESLADATRIKELIRPALTPRIDDREMFMKGIDYSYYYEQED